MTAAKTAPKPEHARYRAALDEAVAELPGAVAAIVRPGDTWFGAAGFADLRAGTPMREDARFYVGSVSKPLTATAVLLAADAGALSVDDPFVRHAPGWTLAGRDDVRVWQVLTHTTGLPREGGMAYWFTGEFPDRDALRAQLTSAEPFAAPGERWRYSNAGFASVGVALEGALGKPYEAAMRETFERLGMARSLVPRADEGASLEGLVRAYTGREGSTERGERPFAGHGAEVGEGPHAGRRERIYHGPAAMAPAFGVVSTALDLARWLRAVLGFDDTLPTGVREAMLTARVPLPEDSDPPGHWTLALRRVDAQPPYYRHGGWFAAYRSHVSLVTDAEVPFGVVVLTNADDADPEAIGAALREAARR